MNRATKLLCSITAAILLLITARTFAAQNAESQELASAAKEIFRSRCFECHGGSETNAGVEILNHQLLVRDLEYVVPGEPGASLVYELMTSDDATRMPPPELPALFELEVDAIRRWIAAGAPSFPEDVPLPQDKAEDEGLAGVAGAEYVLASILKYLDQLTDEDRQHMRFFSAHHLLTAGATKDELEVNREALAKTVNHLSKQPEIVHPEIVDPATRTIFAVDIRSLGWDEKPFRIVRDDDEAEDEAEQSAVNLYDLVLLEYPYAIIYQDSEKYERLVEQYYDVAGLIRPIPYVRVDWFVSVATQSPLYEDLLQLPRTLKELEEQLGVDSASNIQELAARRAGMTVSGVSRNNRVVERHGLEGGAYWKSFDFASSKGQENIFADPIDFQASGGEMIFNLPNGLQGYFVTDATGQRISEAPTGIVTDKFAADKVVRNGLSCIRCHDRGMKTFADAVRPAIDSLPGSPGFSKRQVLDLYATREEMGKHLQADTDRFLRAMEQALSKTQQREPLTTVSRRFLDSPIQLTQASGELGLKTSDGLAANFRTPEFTVLGLAALSSGGAVRRDMWEDFYDRIAKKLGLGIPVVAIDGLTKPDYLPDTDSPKLVLKTNKSGNVFSPGDEMTITVENQTADEIHIELIGTSVDGKKVILVPSTTTVPPSQTFRFPSAGHITIQPKLGRETITLLASSSAFPAGQVLRGDNLGDRVIHNVYELEQSPHTIIVGSDAAEMIKKTITIETR